MGKQLFILSLCLGMLLVVKGQDNSDKINAGELIDVLKTNDLSRFKRLTNLVGYPLADSSKEKNGSLTYITREHKAAGNCLGISMTDKNVITLLNFSTYRKETYDKLKKQIKALGYVSNGLYKKSDKEETEDFEKNEIIISTSAEIIDKRPVEYVFYFLK